MNIQTQPKSGETKHDRFLRLMQKRLGRALEELRLVGQLSSSRYENTDAEAREVIKHLDDAVKDIARAFGVPYTTMIGKGSLSPASGPLTLGPPINVIDCAKALELLKNTDPESIEKARKLLKAAVMGGAR